jgi:hypothetical protein
VSEVSFISSPLIPVTRAALSAEASAVAEPARQNSEPSALDVSHKTVVKTEQLSKFTFGYTFLDPETLRVVGQFPAASPIGAYRK